MQINNLKKWLLIIEVFLVFSPIAICLVAGYLWAIFAILEMLYTFTFPIKYLLGLCVIILATFGVIAVIKLTSLKVNPESAININDNIVFYLFAGCVACLGVLLLIAPKTIWETLPFLLPILVSVQLLWINRSKLRNQS